MLALLFGSKDWYGGSIYLNEAVGVLVKKFIQESKVRNRDGGT